MKKRLYVQIISLLLMAVVLGLWGCEKKMSAPIINSGEYTPTIEDYFPLSAGKTTKIVSTNTGFEPNIVIRDKFECGEGIVLESQSIYPWIHTDLAYSAIVDTSYIYLTESSLYFYETSDSDPEKILEEPIEVGNTWQRFGSYTVEADNLYNNILDSLLIKEAGEAGVIEENKDNLPDDNGFFSGKIYPTTGSGLMTIVAIEDVQMDDGSIYQDCIKIQNESGDYINYYWYAKNYGLIKYIIGATTESLATAATPDGIIVGEYDTGANVF